MLPFHLGLTTSLSSEPFRLYAVNAINKGSSSSNVGMNPFQLFNVYDGELITQTGYADSFNISGSIQNTFSANNPSKDQVAIFQGATVQILDKNTGIKIFQFNLLSDVPSRVSKSKGPQFSVNGDFLFVPIQQAPFYQIFETVNFSDVSNLLPAADRPTAPIACLRFSPNTNVIAICHTDGQSIKVHDGDDWSLGLTQPNAFTIDARTVCEFSPDNDNFIVVNENIADAVRVYDPFTWAEKSNPETPRGVGTELDVSFSPDSTEFLITYRGSSSSEATSLYEASNRTLLPNQLNISSVYWSLYRSDANEIYLGRGTQYVIVDRGDYSTQTKSLTREVSWSAIEVPTSLEANGIPIIFSGSHPLIEYNATQRFQTMNFIKICDEANGAVSISRDGTTIAVYGSSLSCPYISLFSYPEIEPVKTIRMFSTATELNDLTSSDTDNDALALNNDGSHIACSIRSPDGTSTQDLYVYDTSSGTQLAKLIRPLSITGQGGPEVVKYDKTGRYLLVSWRATSNPIVGELVSYDSQNNYNEVASYSLSTGYIRTFNFAENHDRIILSLTGSGNRAKVLDSPDSLIVVQDFDSDTNTNDNTFLAAWGEKGDTILLAGVASGATRVYDGNTYLYLFDLPGNRLTNTTSNARDSDDWGYFVVGGLYDQIIDSLNNYERTASLQDLGLGGNSFTRFDFGPPENT